MRGEAKLDQKAKQSDEGQRRRSRGVYFVEVVEVDSTHGVVRGASQHLRQAVRPWKEKMS